MTNDATIRAYNKKEDDKLARFMIGKAHMEPLAIANFRASFHPIALSAWALLSSVFIQAMGWWPTDAYGFWGYLRPLPAFASCILPIIFLIDWLNRPYFEGETREILARPDIVDVKYYYERSPASGFWLLEYGPKFVGLIALDSSPDSLVASTISQRADIKKLAVKGTSKVAQIRHFYVVEQYRPASMQDDLLSFALKQAFTKGNTIEKVTATASPLTKYLGQSLRKAGFKATGKGNKMGILGWKNVTYEISRSDWEAIQKKDE